MTVLDDLGDSLVLCIGTLNRTLAPWPGPLVLKAHDSVPGAS
jgi:hypothetical protein